MNCIAATLVIKNDVKQVHCVRFLHSHTHTHTHTHIHTHRRTYIPTQFDTNNIPLTHTHTHTHNIIALKT